MSLNLDCVQSWNLLYIALINHNENNHADTETIIIITVISKTVLQCWALRLTLTPCPDVISGLAHWIASCMLLPHSLVHSGHRGHGLAAWLRGWVDLTQMTGVEWRTLVAEDCLHGMDKSHWWRMSSQLPSVLTIPMCEPNSLFLPHVKPTHVMSCSEVLLPTYCLFPSHILPCCSYEQLNVCF